MSLKSTKLKICFAFFGIMMISFYVIFIFQRVTTSHAEEVHRLWLKIDTLKQQVDFLTEQNFKLNIEKNETQKYLGYCQWEFKQFREKAPEPSREYEVTRRRIRKTVNYMWDLVKERIENILAVSVNNSNRLEDIKKEIYEHTISILSDWNQMTASDGYERWRQEENQRLGKYVQEWFYKSQHPGDCESVKFLKCHGEARCGWSCELERYSECFAVAVATQRILVFQRNKNYEPDEYYQYYQPISDDCSEEFSKHVNYTVNWPGTNDAKIIRTTDILRNIKPHIKYLFTAVPQHLVDRLEKLYEEPAVWWIAQILKYLMRPTGKLKELIDTTIVKYHFHKPIVGVHVRRTDKAIEAAPTPFYKYMEAVDRFYDMIELTQVVDKRRIWLATDEPKVVTEAIEKYSHYEILSMNVTTAPTTDLRIKETAVGIIADAHLLARCNYFVGTLSSNVGRRIYEFMFQHNVDAGLYVKSLDTLHFENCEKEVYYRVRIAHNDVNLLGQTFSLPVNETVQRMGIEDHRGLTKVKRLNTENYFDQAFVPAYKLVRLTEIVEFPGHP